MRSYLTQLECTYCNADLLGGRTESAVCQRRVPRRCLYPRYDLEGAAVRKPGQGLR